MDNLKTHPLHILSQAMHMLSQAEIWWVPALQDNTHLWFMPNNPYIMRKHTIQLVSRMIRTFCEFLNPLFPKYNACIHIT